MSNTDHTLEDKIKLIVGTLGVFSPIIRQDATGKEVREACELLSERLHMLFSQELSQYKQQLVEEIETDKQEKMSREYYSIEHISGLNKVISIITKDKGESA